MKYYCEFCKYETTLSGNWLKHEKTKKHLVNYQFQKAILKNNIILKEEAPHKIEKSADGKYICEFCEKKFTQKNNYYTHKKYSCKEKKVHDTDEKSKLFIENAILKTQMEMNEKMNAEMKAKELEMNEKIMSLKDEIISITKTENEHNKKLTVNAGAMVGKSLSTIAYVTQNFKNPNPLKQIDHKTFKQLIYEFDHGVKLDKNTEITDFEACRLITGYFKEHRLHELLGGILGNYYVTTKQESQSLWTTDVSRNTFVINDKINKQPDSDDSNNGSEDDEYEWSIDKMGVRVYKIIIKPLVDHIDDLMKLYICSIYKKITKEPHNEESYHEEISQVNQLRIKITQQKMKDQVLKNLSPQLYLNK